jgi:lipopolysaccharide transport system permease protein
MPFAVYIFLGLVIWMMVSRVLSQGVSSVSANSALLSKIYFPRTYLPISVAIGSLVDFGFGVVALLVLLAISGIMPTLGVVFVPLFVAMALAAALGATFWLAALNAQYRDVEQMMPFLMQLWFFSTPIIYDSNIFPASVQPVFWFNPMAVAVNGLRWAFTGRVALPPPEAGIAAGAGSAIVLVTGYLFFRSRERIFSDVV